MPLQTFPFLPIFAGVAAVVIIITVVSNYCMQPPHTENLRNDHFSNCNTWKEVNDWENKNITKRKKKRSNACSVCWEDLDDLYDRNVNIYSTKCGHLFCKNCIKKLNECPICRSSICNSDLRKINW